MGTKHDMEKKEDGDTGYSQCKKCGQVMFEEDTYFNMVCPVGSREKEELRKRLELIQDKKVNV